MKEKIEAIVKFGVPFLVLLMILYIHFFAKHNGDAEFGSIGQDGGLSLLLILFIVLYFIAGIIVWTVSKNNFIFLSAIFSIITISFYVLISLFSHKYKKVKQKTKTAKYRKTELIKNQRKYDSLTIIIEKSDNNNIEIEKRALLYLEKIDKPNLSKEKREKHVKELELAVKNQSINEKTYNILYHYYISTSKYENSIELLEIALKTLNLTEKDKKKYEGRLENAKFGLKNKQFHEKKDKEWKEQKNRKK